MTHPEPSENPSAEPVDEALAAAQAEAADLAAPLSADPLAEYAGQIAELKDQLLRAVAETENVRKRGQRDVEETSKYAITGFARDLVSVLENLQRASSSIPEELRATNEQLKVLGEGVDMTLREMLGVFERHGIKRIDPMGLKFDHQFHQAVTQIADANAEPGTVLQVFQAGYIIHDRLLRPAMVGVATQGETKKQVDTQA